MCVLRLSKTEFEDMCRHYGGTPEVRIDPISGEPWKYLCKLGDEKNGVTIDIVHTGDYRTDVFVGKRVGTLRPKHLNESYIALPLSNATCKVEKAATGPLLRCDGDMQDKRYEVVVFRDGYWDLVAELNTKNDSKYTLARLVLKPKRELEETK